MPKPELYVIFTGKKPKTPPDTISLSKDFFVGEKTAVDAEVKMLYQEDLNRRLCSQHNQSYHSKYNTVTASEAYRNLYALFLP